MAGLIGAAEVAGIRTALSVFLTHTYTRTPVSESADDVYGPGRTEGAAVTGQPCKYRAEDRLRLADGDRVTVSVPTLTVAHDDPLDVGDLVSNVQDSTGAVLLVGPLTVETMVASAGLGPTLKKRAVLRGGDIR